MKLEMEPNETKLESLATIVERLAHHFQEAAINDGMITRLFAFLAEAPDKTEIEAQALHRLRAMWSDVIAQRRSEAKAFRDFEGWLREQSRIQVAAERSAKEAAKPGNGASAAQEGTPT